MGHIGHAKSAIVGDVISNLFIKCHHCIFKEYYINDYGNQINIFISSIYSQYKKISKNKNFFYYYNADYTLNIAKKLIYIYGKFIMNLSKKNKEKFIKYFSVNEVI